MITIDAAALERKHQLPFLPQIGFVLGSGLGALVPSRKSDLACIAGLLV